MLIYLCHCVNEWCFVLFYVSHIFLLDFVLFFVVYRKWKTQTVNPFQDPLTKCRTLNLAGKDIVDRNSLLDCRNQVIRRMTLQNYCQKQNKDGAVLGNREKLCKLKFSKKGNIMMCIVPKVASRNWYRVFLAIDGYYNVSLVQKYDSTDINSPITNKSEYWRVPGIEKATIKDRQYVFLSSYKILFVRNPYERLVSCYIDKFVLEHDKDFKFIIAAIKEMFVKDDSKQGITFKDFIKFVIHEHKAGHYYRVYHHWLPITSICSPCFIRYDFIGKMETLVKDSQEVLKKTKLEYQNLFPVKGGDSWGVSKDRKRGENVINKYFSQLSKTELAELYEIFKGDFEAFGYVAPLIIPQN